MTFRIKKGKHRAWPWTVGLFFGKREIRREVQFKQGWGYFLDGEDMGDTNKLFGIGYFFSHHKDSARIGWRHDGRGNMILSAYAYVNGERIIKDFAVLHGHQPFFKARISIHPEGYQFEIEQGTKLWQTGIAKTHKKKWAFPLGFYFGGNQPAPHDVVVDMKRL